MNSTTKAISYLDEIQMFAMSLAGMTAEDRLKVLDHPAQHPGCADCVRFERFLFIKEILTSWRRFKKHEVTINREHVIQLWVGHGKPVYDLCLVFQITHERMRQIVKEMIVAGKIKAPIDYRGNDEA